MIKLSQKVLDILKGIASGEPLKEFDKTILKIEYSFIVEKSKNDAFPDFSVKLMINIMHSIVVNNSITDDMLSAITGLFVIYTDNCLREYYSVEKLYKLDTLSEVITSIYYISKYFNFNMESLVADLFGIKDRKYVLDILNKI